MRDILSALKYREFPRLILKDIKKMIFIQKEYILFITQVL